MRLSEVRDFAREEFGDAELGDRRRTQRVVSMAATAYARPAGRILQVFRTSAERQGAYDFLANPECKPENLTAALGESTARRCSEHDEVFVSCDGSSLSIVDHTGTKGFGQVGSTKQRGRGLKVVTALAIAASGATLGVLDQQWWARRSGKKRHDCHARALNNKETKHWINALDASVSRLARHAPNTRVWYLLDRENDKRLCLSWLGTNDASYVVRSSYNRRLDIDGRHYLVDELQDLAPFHDYWLNVPKGKNRTARAARMVVRAMRVRLRLRDQWKKTIESFETTVVEAREEGTNPAREKPIVWRLLTNYRVASAADADRVIAAYAMRWRIEDFHKTWKTGACNIEDSQLRDRQAVVKWATIMASVAARIERLKLLSRTQPELPAGRELTKYEIAALLKLKRMHKKRTETIPDTEPTIAQAVWWLAELGGYTGKSSGGPPGSITINRGLDYIASAAALLEQLEIERKLR